MSDSKIELKKTMYEFSSEASAFLRSGYCDFDENLATFMAYIEGDAAIAQLLKEYASCVPDDFDVQAEVKAVSASYGTRFGPFIASYKRKAGEVYLILKEVSANWQGRVTNVVGSYGNGSTKFDDMTKGFLEAVARKLIDAINRDLTTMGIDMKLSDTVSQVNNINNAQNVAAVVATDGSTVGVSQSSIDYQKLDELISAIRDSMDGVPNEQRESAREYLAGIEEGLRAPEPKKNVVKVLLGAMKAINGGAQFAAAVTALAQFAGVTL